MLIFYFLAVLEIFGNQEKSGINPFAGNDSVITEKAYIHTDRDIYSPGDDIWFSAYLVDGLTLKPSGSSSNLHVELITPDLKIADSRIVRLAGGLGNGDFHLKDGLVSGNYIIRCYTNYMRNFGEEVFFRKVIRVVAPGDAEKLFSKNIAENDQIFELSFYPEGGSLVENVPSVVAFKAEDANGAGIDVKGRIYSTDGQFTGSFETSGKGMGILYFTPERGKSYYSIYKAQGGAELRNDFPQSFKEGVVLNVSGNRNDSLYVFVRTNPVTLRLLQEADLDLSVFSKGALFKTLSFRMNSLNGHLKIYTNDIPDGVAVIRLSGPSHLPLCERLVYIENHPSPEIGIKTDKKIYNTRDSVEVKISLGDSSRLATEAYLSFSAAEESSSGNEKHPSTIASWFLLESEVRGPVAEPGYYFDRSNPGRLKDLDLLLLTQGWRDFKWKYDELKFFPEYGFSISGRVMKRLANKELAGVMVNVGVFDGEKPTIRLIPVDSTGKFILENLDLSGSTKVVASITDEKGNFRGVLKMDSLRYSPESIRASIKQLALASEKEQDSIGDAASNPVRKFFNSAEFRLSLQKKYKLSDTITPGEVIVRSIRRDAPESGRARSRKYLMATPDKEIVITPVLEIYKTAYGLIESRVLSPPNFLASPSPNTVINPLYMIDGAFATRADVEGLSLKWVERIDVLSNENSYTQFKYQMLGEPVRQGSFASNEGMKSSKRWDNVIFQDKYNTSGPKRGVISIILKSDADIARITPSHSVNFKMKGYDIPRVFYSPRHKTSLQNDYKPDLRTTLFWKPDITLSGDSAAVLKYFNADNSSTIRLTIEGITSYGIPVTGHAEYTVK